MNNAGNSDLFEREDSDYDTYIAQDVKFSGNIHFEKPFVIKGQVSGNIEATSDLLVDTDAVVNSDISAERIIVRGKVTGNINYSKEVVPFENIVDGKIELSGRLVDISYLCSESINKGYMYAASNETEYRTKAIAEISYSEIVDYLDIEMSKDTFVLENGDKVNTNATIYKRTEISKANFDALFGEEGKIEIYGNGEKVAEINKETEANEAGNIEINYEKEVNSVKIVTSKPVAEGKLEVNNVKAVKAETGYGLEEIKAIKEIEAKAKVKTNITEEEKVGRVRLNETVSKAEITMQAENLSTVVKNENVEMRVLFRTDSNMYDLYKNPSIETELPEQVKEVSLRSIEAAFGEGFSLNWYDIVENAEGKKVIRIALTGEQTKYAIDISEGMSLTIKADMMLDKKSGSSEEKVKLRYRNEKAIGYDNGGEAEGRVGIEAPTGVVAINSIDVEGRTSTSLSSKEQNIFLIKMEELREIALQVSLLWDVEQAKIASDFVYGYVELLCALYRQCICVDKLRKQKNINLTEAKQSIDESAQEGGLNDAIKLIAELYNRMKENNVLNTLKEQIKLK